jgi:PleD family two-component response regulator
VIERLKVRLGEIALAYDWPITFSVGLVTYHSPPETIESMLKFSDEIMYNAKSSGKNCTKHIVINSEGQESQHF